MLNNKKLNMLNVNYIKKLLNVSDTAAEEILDMYNEDYMDYCTCTTCLQYDLVQVYNNYKRQ